jgi:hypothetical protein
VSVHAGRVPRMELAETCRRLYAPVVSAC